MSTNGHTNGNGGPDNGTATLIAPEVGRVRRLLTEFKELEAVHAKKASTLQNEALQWCEEIRAQTWRIAAKAVEKALKPSFPGAPPTQLASSTIKIMELQDEAAAGALKASPTPTLDDVLDQEDQQDKPLYQVIDEIHRRNSER